MKKKTHPNTLLINLLLNIPSYRFNLFPMRHTNPQTKSLSCFFPSFLFRFNTKEKIKTKLNKTKDSKFNNNDYIQYTCINKHMN